MLGTLKRRLLGIQEQQITKAYELGKCHAADKYKAAVIQAGEDGYRKGVEATEADEARVYEFGRLKGRKEALEGEFITSVNTENEERLKWAERLEELGKLQKPIYLEWIARHIRENTWPETEEDKAFIKMNLDERLNDFFNIHKKEDD